MSEANGVVIVPAPNTLATKAKRAGGLSVAEMVRLADSAIVDQVDLYRTARDEDLTRLERLSAELLAGPAAPAGVLQQLFDIAHDVKGQGGTFGYQLITDIGDGICRMVEAILPAAQLRPTWTSAIATHVRALRMVADRDIRGNGDAAGGELLAGLRAVAARVKHEATAAAALQKST